jgi:hypothetical protein
MFFRRERPKEPTFAEKLEHVRRAGFEVTAAPTGETRVARRNCAVMLRDPGYPTGRAGLVMNGEIGALTDEGFQKFFRTPSGKKKPALAHELKALHDFEEDLKEQLGVPSLYNESLGTVSTYYLYDRVQDRDRGVPKRIWET